MTVEEFSQTLALQIKFIAEGHGWLGATFSVDVTEPAARLQVTLKPKSILIKKVNGETL